MLRKLTVLLLLIVSVGSATACCLNTRRQKQRPKILTVVPSSAMVPTVQMVLDGKAIPSIHVPARWRSVLQALRRRGYDRVILGNWEGEPCYVAVKLQKNPPNVWPGEIYVDRNKVGRLEVVKVLLPERY